MAHLQKHSITDTAHHTGISGTAGNIVQLDANGLIADSSKAFSTDGTLASNSDLKISTEKAIKTYVDGLLGQSVTTGSTPTFAGLKLTDSLVINKASGNGIKVDTASPTWGWRDKEGSITVKGTGTNNPAWAAYRTSGSASISAFLFANGASEKEAWIEFHMPHDWVPGTDLYIHAHWSQIVVDTGGAAGVPGVCEWVFDISYADGHGTAGGAADPFIAPITRTITQQASTTQYGHMIAEVQVSNNGGTGGMLDSATLQVDGLLLVRIHRDSAHVNDTLNQDVYLHFVDIHYQSTNVGTKQKAPNFYV